MKHVNYAVVILNYNTIEDAINAAKNVIDNSVCVDYIVCIADNNSSIVDDRIKLKNIKLVNTISLQIENNEGYACGNNFTIRKLNELYEIDYIVIMNPDIQIVHHGCIERMIETIEGKGSEYIGAQPLINTISWEEKPQYQTNIRRIPTDSIDILIYNSGIFRKIFKNRFKYLNYVNERPYNRNLEYEVPSGAFFVIKRNEFENVGLFDEETFMYCEEPILAYKIKALGLKFILVPELIVNHFHGKSTGSHGKMKTKFSHRAEKESWEIFMQKYLRLAPWKIQIIKTIMDIEYCLKSLL